MQSKITEFKGKLVMKAGSIILETEAGDLFPLPYPMQAAISIKYMKIDAVHEYGDYIGRLVAFAGYLQEELIYDAKVIRDYKPHKPDKYTEDYWNNRISKADILFKARKLPGYNIHFSVDVRQMITTNDSVIYKDLSTHSLLISDPDNCDENIYRIYRHSRLKKINPYLYKYDKQIFGCEFFMYPYELRQLKIGDCDDWGIELASYLIAAGVPEWRVRCVVGLTYSGDGHLTVYVLADDLKTWHHLNSTTPWSMIKNKRYYQLADFPKSGDANDKIGIKDVWFSFNSKYAWHAFETHASEKGLQNIPWANNFEITPIFE